MSKDTAKDRIYRFIDDDLDLASVALVGSRGGYLTAGVAVSLRPVESQLLGRARVAGERGRAGQRCGVGGVLLPPSALEDEAGIDCQGDEADKGHDAHDEHDEGLSPLPSPPISGYLHVVIPSSSQNSRY